MQIPFPIYYRAGAYPKIPQDGDPTSILAVLARNKQNSKKMARFLAELEVRSTDCCGTLASFVTEPKQTTAAVRCRTKHGASWLKFFRRADEANKEFDV